MARKSHEDALGVTGAETIIGAGVVVKGNVSSSSDITIDATLDGDVTTTGDITIGVNATVNGTVRGTNIMIAGRLIGDLHAEGLATIRETGQIQGNITSESLAIVTGGIFVGKSSMPIPPELPTSSEPEEPMKLHS